MEQNNLKTMQRLEHRGRSWLGVLSFVKTRINPAMAIICLSLLVSCASDDVKIDRGLGYQDFIRDDLSQAEVNSASAKRVVTVPTAKNNYIWNNSNFSLSGIPDNIVGSDVTKNAIKHYSLRNASDDHSDKTVVITDKYILWLSGNSLYAYDVNYPAKLKWSTIISQSNHELLGGGVYAYGDYIAATCGSRDLVILDVNGNILWTFSLANITRSTPVIYNKTVVVNTVDNILYGFDLDTGMMKWLVKEAHEKLGFLGAASPEFFENTVIMPFSSGKLVAINIADGHIKWSVSLSLGLGVRSYINDIDMVPVIKDNTVFLSSANGILYAIDAKTGVLKWNNLQAGGGDHIWIAGDYVYAVNKNNVLLALYKADGSIQWTSYLEDPNQKKSDNIFFNEDNTIFQGPTMINSKLYVTSSKGALLIIDPTSGEKLDEIIVPKSIYSPVIAVNDKIYFINSFGYLSVIG